MNSRPRPPTFVMGDIHGHLEQVSGLLQATGLVDEQAHWSGGEATLFFIGDFCDRGPDGIGALELAMRLEAEAAAAGGHVGAVLGNHDALLVAVYRFGAMFEEGWLRNGGQSGDLERFRDHHLAWLANLPFLLRLDHWLLVHADATFIYDYGRTVQEVNQALSHVLFQGSPEALGTLLDQFSEHLAFTGPDGATVATQFLARYGGEQIIHGHSPISYARGIDPYEVVAAWPYAQGLCINVDGGLYLGGSGFLYRLPERLGLDRRRKPR